MPQTDAFKSIIAPLIAAAGDDERPVLLTTAFYYWYAMKKSEGKSKWQALDAARQWAFTTKNTCVVDMAGVPLPKFDEAMPREYELWQKLKNDHREEALKTANLCVISVTNLRTKMIQIANDTIKTLRERFDLTAIMYLPLVVLYNAGCRLCEIDMHTPREGGHVNTRDDWTIYDDWTIHQTNGAKHVGEAVRAPHVKISLIEPDLFREVLDAWFDNAENLKSTTLCNGKGATRWYQDRLTKMLAAYEFENVVTSGKKITPYDFKRLGITSLPYIHDITNCAHNRETAIAAARRVQGGHVQTSACHEQYANVDVDKETACEPLLRTLDIKEHNFIVTNFVEEESELEEEEESHEKNKSNGALALLSLNDDAKRQKI